MHSNTRRHNDLLVFVSGQQRLLSNNTSQTKECNSVTPSMCSQTPDLCRLSSCSPYIAQQFKESLNEDRLSDNPVKLRSEDFWNDRYSENVVLWPIKGTLCSLLIASRPGLFQFHVETFRVCLTGIF